MGGGFQSVAHAEIDWNDSFACAGQAGWKATGQGNPGLTQVNVPEGGGGIVTADRKAATCCGVRTPKR